MRNYFKKALGSEKSYLFFKMQLAIVISIAISMFYAVFRDYFYLQIVPLLLLASSFLDLYRSYRKEFWLHASIFSMLFLIIVLTPLFSKLFSINFSSLDSLRYIIYVALALLVILLLSRTILVKRFVEGKVILADKSTAVVDVDFDLLAGIRPGKYVVENNGAKKGDFVKIRVRRGFLRGAYLHKIAGKRA